MKKIALLIALGTLITQAGMFSAVQGMGMKEIKPKAEYTLDTNGVNPRVYEFTPQSDKSKLCILIVLTGDEPSSTLQCFDKRSI